MQTVALVILVLAGLWLSAVGLMMAFRPRYALHLLSLTASSHRVNWSEQGPRLLTGIALVVRADHSKVALLFEVGGLFIIVSSVVLLLVPLAWHRGYAIWWANRLAPMAVRLLAPFSVIGGAILIYAAW